MHCSHHHVQLNKELKADLAWWRAFVQPWDGVGLLHGMKQSTLEFYTDASGAWGCGPWHGASWFQYPWGVEEQCLDIVLKELLPIVMAAAIWGSQ